MPDKNLSPLEPVLVTCPACGKSYLEQRLNPQSYRVTASDTDFYPSQRVWLNSQINQVNPLAYFMQVCPNCFFTVEANGSSSLKSAQLVTENPQQQLQIERHKELLPKPGSGLDKLAHGYRIAEDPFSKVVLKFLLGIFDEKLKDHYSNYNLGRYYLRLAWVFREGQNWEKANLPKDWPTLGQNLKELSERHEKYLGPVEKLRGLLDEKFLSLDQDREEPGKQHYSYDEILRQLEKEVVPDGQKPEEIWGQTKSHEGDNFGFSRPVQNFFDLSGFLLDLKSIWPGVPLNETEALKFSLSYYHQYFESLQEESGARKIQTAYLIGELSRRAGEYPQSRKFFNLAIALGHDSLQMEKETYRTAFTQKIIDLAAQQHSLAVQEQRLST
jgi:hypothetical protein